MTDLVTVTIPVQAGLNHLTFDEIVDGVPYRTHLFSPGSTGAAYVGSTTQTFDLTVALDGVDSVDAEVALVGGGGGGTTTPGGGGAVWRGTVALTSGVFPVVVGKGGSGGRGGTPVAGDASTAFGQTAAGGAIAADVDGAGAGAWPFTFTPDAGALLYQQPLTYGKKGGNGPWDGFPAGDGVGLGEGGTNFDGPTTNPGQRAANGGLLLRYPLTLSGQFVNVAGAWKKLAALPSDVGSRASWQALGDRGLAAPTIAVVEGGDYGKALTVVTAGPPGAENARYGMALWKKKPVSSAASVEALALIELTGWADEMSAGFGICLFGKDASNYIITGGFWQSSGQIMWPGTGPAQWAQGTGRWGVKAGAVEQNASGNLAAAAYAPGTKWWVRARWDVAGTLSRKVWADGTEEPGWAGQSSVAADKIPAGTSFAGVFGSVEAPIKVHYFAVGSDPVPMPTYPAHVNVSGAWKPIVEGWVNAVGEWKPLWPIIPAYNDATGGSVTHYERDGAWFRVHTFTESGDFVVTKGDRPFRTFLLAGGATGGKTAGGGGGGGGVDANDAAILAPGVYPVVVGLGGKPAESADNNGADGHPSTFNGVTVPGGGGGGSSSLPGKDGGSGGGGGYSTATTTTGNPPGQGVAGRGFPGGTGVSTSGQGGAAGGGGGAAQAGSPGTVSSGAGQGGKGGDGISTDIRGVEEWFGGGGGGRASGGAAPGGLGGKGGGTAGGVGTVASLPAPANSGGGTGGMGSSVLPGDGGSGIFIVSYEVAPPTFNDATGGVVTEVVNYLGTGQTWRIHTFDGATGNFNVRKNSFPFKVLAVGGGGGASAGDGVPTTFGSGGHGAQVVEQEMVLDLGIHAVASGRRGTGGLTGQVGTSGSATTITKDTVTLLTANGGAAAAAAPGGQGLGGDGAGGPHSGKNGGPGALSDIDGTPTWFGAGGGGAVSSTGDTGGRGGEGGGNGGSWDVVQTGATGRGAGGGGGTGGGSRGEHGRTVFAYQIG